MSNPTTEIVAKHLDNIRDDATSRPWWKQLLIIGSVAPVTVFLLTVIQPRVQDGGLSSRDRKILRTFLNRPESPYGWGWTLSAVAVTDGAMPQLAPDCTVIMLHSQMPPWSTLLQSRSTTRFTDFLFITPDGRCLAFPRSPKPPEDREFFDAIGFRIHDEASLDVLATAFQSAQHNMLRQVRSEPKQMAGPRQWMLGCDPDHFSCWLKVTLDDAGRILRIERR